MAKAEANRVQLTALRVLSGRSPQTHLFYAGHQSSGLHPQKLRGSIHTSDSPAGLLQHSAVSLAALANLGTALSQTVNPPKQEISLAGSPFAVTTTTDGRYLFASLSGAANGIAVIKQGENSATLVRVIPTGGGTFGLTATRDGRYLLDTVQPIGDASTPQGVQFIDVRKAITGQAQAVAVRNSPCALQAPAPPDPPP